MMNPSVKKRPLVWKKKNNNNTVKFHVFVLVLMLIS